MIQAKTGVNHQEGASVSQIKDKMRATPEFDLKRGFSHTYVIPPYLSFSVYFKNETL